MAGLTPTSGQKDESLPLRVRSTASGIDIEHREEGMWPFGPAKAVTGEGHVRQAW